MKNNITRKLLALTAILAMAFCLCACGSSKPLNLDGTWVSEDNDGASMEATISGETMEIYWTTDGTKALYWAGSVTLPDKNVLESDDYSWTSKADTEKNDASLLASLSKTKKFNYTDKKIEYKQSALGVTTTIKLIRKDS